MPSQLMVTATADSRAITNMILVRILKRASKDIRQIFTWRWGATTSVGRGDGGS
jgi:hypothetical protein